MGAGRGADPEESKKKNGTVDCRGVGCCEHTYSNVSSVSGSAHLTQRTGASNAVES